MGNKFKVAHLCNYCTKSIPTCDAQYSESNITDMIFAEELLAESALEEKKLKDAIIACRRFEAKQV